MYLYLYSYRRETARQLRMYAQLTRCFSAVAELLVNVMGHSIGSCIRAVLEGGEKTSQVADLELRLLPNLIASQVTSTLRAVCSIGNL